MPLVRGLLTDQGLSETASDVILQAWKSGTQKQYKSYLQRWELYCGEREINPVSSSVIDGLNFLSELYQKQLSYSAINTARSALSNVIFPPEGCTFGNHPLVTKFLRGVYTTRPSLPRYQEIWDVSIVLKYLKTLHPPENLSIMNLTLKTTMLIALLSGQRCQTIHALDISAMTLSDGNCIFYIQKLLKTSRPGKHLGRLELRAFDEDKPLCVVTLLKEYIERTKLIRGTHSQLLLSYCKPFKPVSSDTISRWLKKVLENAGININDYGAHSTRSASTSAAKAANMPVKTIMNAAGWANVGTFKKFYDKPITDNDSDNFGYNLLKAVAVE